MKTLFCFYDMAVSPCSYDFFIFLYSAEICRVRRGLDDLQLILIHGQRNKFRDDKIRTDEQNEMFFNNVIVPGISLLPSCSGFMWQSRSQVSTNGLAETQIFPRGFRLEKPVHGYLPSGLVASMIRQDKLSFLEAPAYARNLATDLISYRCPEGAFVTISAREIEREDTNKTRTLKYPIWRKAIEKLDSLGIKTFVIRDSSALKNPPLFEGVDELPEASIHVPLRMAVYERALLNFTKNNGPSVLQLFGKTRSIYFNEFDDSIVSLSRSWYASKYGMVEGDQFPFTTQSKKVVWNDESEKRIIDEAAKALESGSNNLVINGFSSQANLRESLVVAFNYLIMQLQYGFLAEDVDLFKRIKVLNRYYDIFDDLDKQLKISTDGQISQKIIQELITKTNGK